jgi:hypothetical protein
MRFKHFALRPLADPIHPSRTHQSRARPRERERRQWVPAAPIWIRGGQRRRPATHQRRQAALCGRAFGGQRGRLKGSRSGCAQAGGRRCRIQTSRSRRWQIQSILSRRCQIQPILSRRRAHRRRRQLHSRGQLNPPTEELSPVPLGRPGRCRGFGVVLGVVEVPSEQPQVHGRRPRRRFGARRHGLGYLAMPPTLRIWALRLVHCHPIFRLSKFGIRFAVVM